MGPQEHKEDGAQDEQQPHDHNDNRHTGEGAASAMAHLQERRNRHQPGDANDAGSTAGKS